MYLTVYRLFFPLLPLFSFLSLLLLLLQFPHSDKDAILAKLSGPAAAHISDVEKAFKEEDKSSTGKMTVQQFTSVHASPHLPLLDSHVPSHTQSDGEGALSGSSE